MFFILASRSLGQEIKTQSCFEGADIVLRFESNIKENKCNFTIDFNGTIFARNSERINPNTLPTEKYERTAVHIVTYFNITISINKTRPSDSGNYTCVFRCRNITRIQVYVVTVFHPPILTGCDWHSNSSIIPPDHNVYSVLVCTFKDGNPASYAICYGTSLYGTDFVLPVTVSVEGNLKNANFLIKKNTELSCCVVNDHYKKNKDHCNEYQRLNRWSSTDITSVDDTSRSSLYTESLPVRSAEATYSQTPSVGLSTSMLNTPSKVLIPVLCLVLIVSIIIVAVIVIVLVKKRRCMRRNDNEGTIHEMQNLNPEVPDSNGNITI